MLVVLATPVDSETNGLPMSVEEQSVYLEILRGARPGEIGLEFPKEYDPFVHHVAFIWPLDTLVTTSQSPREFDDAVEAFRHSWRGEIDMSALAGEGIEVVELFGNRWPGCRVLLSHIGFENERKRAVAIIWYSWHKKNGMFYTMKAVVYLSKHEDQWKLSQYRPLDVSRGWDEYVGP